MRVSWCARKTTPAHAATAAKSPQVSLRADDVLAQHPHAVRRCRRVAPQACRLALRAGTGPDRRRGGLLFWLLAMTTYSAQDPAFSTSGSGAAVHNWGGRLGAWLADGSYFLLGYLVLVVLRRRHARLAVDTGALDARWRRAGCGAGRAAARPSGSRSPCCCAPARRSSGRASTASRTACLTTPAARWASSSVRLPSTGWGSPARAWSRWHWSWSARPWCSASPGAMSPSASARRIEALVRTRREKREIAQDLALRPAGRARTRGNGAGRARRERGAPSDAGADRAGRDRRAQERARGQGAPEAAVHRDARQQAAAGRPARWRAGAPGNGVGRHAGDDRRG